MDELKIRRKCWESDARDPAMIIVDSSTPGLDKDYYHFECVKVAPDRFKIPYTIRIP